MKNYNPQWFDIKINNLSWNHTYSQKLRSVPHVFLLYLTVTKVSQTKPQKVKEIKKKKCNCKLAQNFMTVLLTNAQWTAVYAHFARIYKFSHISMHFKEYIYQHYSHLSIHFLLINYCGSCTQKSNIQKSERERYYLVINIYIYYQTERENQIC